jgi:hypothetical protein
MVQENPKLGVSAETMLPASTSRPPSWSIPVTALANGAVWDVVVVTLDWFR